MNEETNELLNSAIRKGLEVAEMTGEFVIDQAPELLKEFYMWRTASNVFFIVLGALIIYLAYKVPLLLMKDMDDDFERGWDSKYMKGKYADEGWVIASYIILTFSGILGISMIISSIYNLTYILIAPKLYLIDYFR